MPTYEYECLNCKYRFEKFQTMTEEPLRVCPRCGGELRRLIGTGAGIIFKGEGFYHTDYKRQSGRGDVTKKNNKESENKSKNKDEK
jgi:putative FmdB family regulatory protein